MSGQALLPGAAIRLSGLARRCYPRFASGRRRPGGGLLASTGRETARSFSGLALPGAVAIVFLLGAVFELRCAPAAVSAEAAGWLSSWLAPRVGEGDQVIVTPPALAPAVAKILGRPVAGGYPIALLDEQEGVSRGAWLLSLDGARGPRAKVWDETAVAVDEGAAHGLRRADARGEARVTFDFWSHLDAARPVVRRSDGASAPCTAEPAGRWRCGSRDWAFVGRYVARIGRQARRCVWVHPHTGAALHVTYPDVPLGDEIRGGYGFVDGTPEGASVGFRVEVDGARVARQTIAGKPAGWKSFSARTSGPSGRRGEVSFVFDCDNNRWRKLCFDAVVVERGGGGR